MRWRGPAAAAGERRQPRRGVARPSGTWLKNTIHVAAGRTLAGWSGQRCHDVPEREAARHAGTPACARPAAPMTYTSEPSGIPRLTSARRVRSAPRERHPTLEGISYDQDGAGDRRRGGGHHRALAQLQQPVRPALAAVAVPARRSPRARSREPRRTSPPPRRRPIHSAARRALRPTDFRGGAASTPAARAADWLRLIRATCLPRAPSRRLVRIVARSEPRARRVRRASVAALHRTRMRMWTPPSGVSTSRAGSALYRTPCYLKPSVSDTFFANHDQSRVPSPPAFSLHLHRGSQNYRYPLLRRNAKGSRSSRHRYSPVLFDGAPPFFSSHAAAPSKDTRRR